MSAPCNNSSGNASKLLDQVAIQEGIGFTEKKHIEMLSYQKQGNSVMVKGKLFLESLVPLSKRVGDTYSVEFFEGRDLNGQLLLIIREVVNVRMKRGQEMVNVEDCNLYVTRITDRVKDVLDDVMLGKTRTT